MSVSVNTSGCSAMAKGGSGDVLTGIIAALTAQGMEEAQAARMGVYIHGLSGERAAVLKGNYGVLALCHSTAATGIHRYISIPVRRNRSRIL